MKKTLIINGHPNKNSYCGALAESFYNGCLKSGNEVKLIHLNELNFDLNLRYGYAQKIELEEDLKKSQELILWAQHLVIIHPVWWGSVPALLKGFFDRVLLPGFAFKYKENSQLWDKLLKGKSAHLIYTTDTPPFIYKWIFGEPSVNTVKKRVLHFCGVSPVKVTALGPIRNSTIEYRNRMITLIYEEAKKVK